jgi:hypothetical protein
MFGTAPALFLCDSHNDRQDRLLKNRDDEIRGGLCGRSLERSVSHREFDGQASLTGEIPSRRRAQRSGRKFSAEKRSFLQLTDVGRQDLTETSMDAKAIARPRDGSRQR